MDKSELKEELGTLGKQIGTMVNLIGTFYAKLEEIDFQEDLDEYAKKFAGSEKLTKKQRRDLAIAHIQKAYPKFCQQMKELELTLDGMYEIIQDKVKKLEDVECSLCELEELKDNIEQTMNDI